MASELDSKWTLPYLQESPYVPIDEEIVTPLELKVSGSLPPEISGAFLRNGPNPYYRDFKHHHWFDGDGMLHKIHIHQGRAFYQRRYVQTIGLSIERSLGKRFFAGIDEIRNSSLFGMVMNIGTSILLDGHVLKDTSNTDLIYYNGELISLWWLSGLPYRIDPQTLATRGVHTFDGTYKGNMAAHARVDSETNDLFFISFSQLSASLKINRVGGDGKWRWSHDIDIPFPRIYHDLLITKNYVIVMDFPFGFVREKTTDPSKMGIDPKYPSRIHLLSRETGNCLHVFSFPPTYSLHGINAFETPLGVSIVACKYDDPIVNAENDSPLIPKVGTLRVKTSQVLWKLDFSTGQLIESALDDANTEFPTINFDHQGKEFRYWYAPLLNAGPTVLFTGVQKHDLLTGKIQALRMGKNIFCEEFVFIPKPQVSSEDDGYLATMVHDMNTSLSSFKIYDAKSMDAEAVATIHFPGLIPHGFHSKWLKL